MANETEEDINLKMVGLELMFLTPEKYSNEDGITAVELAKLVNLPVETVKKKLQILKEKENLSVKKYIRYLENSHGLIISALFLSQWLVISIAAILDIFMNLLISIIQSMNVFGS